MLFDSKNPGKLDVSIASELARFLDDGEPKEPLSESVKRGLKRILRRDGAKNQVLDETCIPETNLKQISV